MHFLIGFSEEKFATFWAVTWGMLGKRNESKMIARGSGSKNVIFVVTSFLNGCLLKCNIFFYYFLSCKFTIHIYRKL